MKKEASVVMLPTDKESQIAICKYGDRKGLFYGEEASIEKSLQNQHLYITDDSEIKEGDWVIETANDNAIEQFANYSLNQKSMGCKKIIATTDPELRSDGLIEDPNNPKDNLLIRKGLPQPSQAFIQKYVSEANKGNIIEEVYMEKEKLIGIKFTRFEGASNIVYTIEDYKGKEPDTIMVTWTDRRNRPHYRAVPYQVKHVNELIGKGKWKVINR